MKTAMTKEQALHQAREVARSQGWPWEKPVRVTLLKPWWIFRLFGWKNATWSVFTNTNFRGMNVIIDIDDASGRIKGKWFAPR